MLEHHINTLRFESVFVKKKCIQLTQQKRYIELFKYACTLFDKNPATYTSIIQVLIEKNYVSIDVNRDSIPECEQHKYILAKELQAFLSTLPSLQYTWSGEGSLPDVIMNSHIVYLKQVSSKLKKVQFDCLNIPYSIALMNISNGIPPITKTMDPKILNTAIIDIVDFLFKYREVGSRVPRGLNITKEQKKYLNMAFSMDYVHSKGLTHAKLAEPLHIMLKLPETHCQLNDKEWPLAGGTCSWQGTNYTVEFIPYFGFQESIFDDEFRSNMDMKITNTATGLSISFSAMLVSYIKEYGFYEGDTPFRLSPESIILVIGFNNQ